jgi:uncharacterized protein (DUF302 family)
MWPPFYRKNSGLITPITVCWGRVPHRLDADPDAGALFPCNIIVRPVADGTVVTFMHPQTVFALANNAVINQVADKAMLMLTEVKNRLEQE